MLKNDLISSEREKKLSEHNPKSHARLQSMEKNQSLKINSEKLWEVFRTRDTYSNGFMMRKKD